jgi:cell wall-associated NlpC family hydrolase
MIVIGGIEYMTSELISSKEAGKERIRGAIFGLLLALGAWTLLNQINPDILNTNLNSLQNVTVSVDVMAGGESNTPFTPLNSAALATTPINCSTNLVTTATSFIGNTTYSQNPTDRNTISNGKAIEDCSSFVNQVYKCSQIPSPGNTTAQIFDTTKGATAITAQDLTTLQVGDLIGWKKGDTKGQVETDGHVLIYIGNGKVIDAQGGTTNGVTSRLLSDNALGRLTYIKRAP